MYAIKVINVPHAFIGVHERSVVLITRSALKVVSDEELRAAPAHEAAHEYVHADYERAMIDGRHGRLQDLELVCDITAVLILRAIGQDARSLPAVIEKLQRFNRFTSDTKWTLTTPMSRFAVRSSPGSGREFRELVIANSRNSRPDPLPSR